MKIQLLAFFVVLVFASSELQGQSDNIVLRTDLNGEVVYGSIENLIAVIEAGKSIRVGWQLDLNRDSIPDLEHWIDAKFISILNGHVFNQIQPIYKQTPKQAIPQVLIIDSPMQWTGIIGTNGKLLSRYIIPGIESIEDENIYNSMKKQTAVRTKTVATVWAVKQ